MEEAHPLISHQSQAGQVVEGNGEIVTRDAWGRNHLTLSFRGAIT
jgi:hypothetical protein